MARIRLAVQRARQRDPQTPEDAERRLAVQIEQRRARAAQQDRDGCSGSRRSQREGRP